MCSKDIEPAELGEPASEAARSFTTKAWMPSSLQASPITTPTLFQQRAARGATEPPACRAPMDKGFRAQTVDHLCHLIETRLAATCIVVPRSPSIDAWVNFRKLPRSELFFCSPGAALKLKFADSDYVRVQFQHAGSGVSCFGQQHIPVTAQQSCLSPAAATIEFSADFQQLVWRIPRSELIRKLTDLTGVRIIRRIDFDGPLHRAALQSNPLMQILSCLLTAISFSSPQTNPHLIGELEQSLMVALLCGARHTLRDLLEDDGTQVPPWRVRRAEEFIASNLDQSLSVEQIATAAGISTRSLHRAFRQSRGYSPMQFVRQQRLLRARSMLRAHATESVIEVCLACGFSDISHFSREFSKAFGESPSTVLGGAGSLR